MNLTLLFFPLIRSVKLTEGLDVAVYVKGDRKPISLFWAELEVNYDGENLGPTPAPTEHCGPSCGK